MTRPVLAAVLLIGACTRSVVDPPVSDAGSTVDPVDVQLTVDVSAPMPATRLLSAGHAFGGDIWVPFTPAAAVESHLLEPAHKLGALRFSLQRLFEAPGVSHADFVTGLPKALASLPELTMLDHYAQHGGELIFDFMAMPAWLGDARTITPSVCSASALQWRPPSDFDLYATEVVAPVVAFFAQRYGPGQRYEVGNEPTSCTWYGTTAQYQQLYAAVVKGARMADPTARIGGPSHADSVFSSRTLNDPPSVNAPFVQAFIAAAASAHLPIDFVTLHSYNNNPSSNEQYHHTQVETVRGWLSDAGYDGQKTEIINDEWYDSVYENLSSDNVNNTFIGAAYAGATMLAFDEAGYDNHATQSYQDLGGENEPNVVSPLFASQRGIPRAGYQVFSLLSKLDGQRVASTSDNPWVRVATSVGAKSTVIFAASFTPWATLSLEAALTQLLKADPTLSTTLAPVQTSVMTYLQGPPNAEVPSAIASLLSPSQRASLHASKTLFDHEASLRRDWGVGEQRTDPVTAPGRQLTWRLTVNGLQARPTRVTRATINSKHALTHAQLTAIFLDLTTASIPLACEASKQVRTMLGSQVTCSALDAFCASGGASTTGFGQVSDCALLETFVADIITSATMAKTQTLLDRANASLAIRDAFSTAFTAAFARYQPLYDAVYARPEVALFEEDVTSAIRFDGGVLVIDSPAEPFSVVAFTLEP